ncbi:major histocompatibility complex class I-related gene protein-like [Anabas testudineus]|uniref:Ig-like domain-containing protein n=1 Tax=Anabas testudineus TaxID=64144 RepID=A0A3Q1HHC2_ANATE|nr:major histocompatibility complex class I-related gene protein-like [Anabas testudineus]
MKKIFLLFLFCHVSSPVKHSLTFFLTTSSGLGTFPEFMAFAMVDGDLMGTCDSNNRTAEPKEGWAKNLFKDDPDHLEWYTDLCKGSHDASIALIQELQLLLNQTGGVHVLQHILGYELDDGFMHYDQYGFDGEDFMYLDHKTRTWVFSEKAATFKNKWGRIYTSADSRDLSTSIWPKLLKRYLDYANSALQRKVLPSVSLLQKTPSSPVSCHATGFYPDRVDMFWRKDGEEIHEDVDHGEILPNHDGTFQMRVDLDLSSVKPEDWSRYDCVFQISAVKKDVITKLDKAEIRTNWGSTDIRNNEVPPSVFPAAAVIGVVVGLLLLFITGLFIWRKKRNGFRPATTSDPSDRNPGPDPWE